MNSGGRNSTLEINSLGIKDMKTKLITISLGLTLVTVTPLPAAEIPPSITTPDKVETRIGTLEFKDGAPSKATLDKVYDNLDFTHAFEAFVNTFQGVNAEAIKKGFADIGVPDNELLIFSDLMDAKSLFLTANADTVYFVGGVDLSKDRWSSKRRRARSARSMTPVALGHRLRRARSHRGEGGKYLVLPPGYAGPVPEGGFFVCRSRTSRVLVLGRMFMDKDDPKPTVAVIKAKTKIYPFEAGGVGTSIAEFLRARPGSAGSCRRRRSFSMRAAARS